MRLILSIVSVVLFSLPANAANAANAVAGPTQMPPLKYAEELPPTRKPVYLHLSGYTQIMGRARLNKHILESVKDVCGEDNLICTTMETIRRTKSKMLHRYHYYSFWEQFFDMMIEREKLGIDIEMYAVQLEYYRDWMRNERQYNFTLLIEVRLPERGNFPSHQPMIHIKEPNENKRFCESMALIKHICLPESFNQPFQDLSSDFELQPE